MALESGTYINDFVITNPVSATDSVSQGANQLRLIKTFAKNTFPNASKPFYFPETVAIDHTDSPYSVPTNKRNVVVLVDASSLAVTVNLPDASTVGDGARVSVVRVDTAATVVTIDGASAQTIDGASTRTVPASTVGRYTAITLECDGTEWYSTGETITTQQLVSFFGVTTAGDMVYYTGSAFARLAAGTANQVMYHTGTAPAWQSLATLLDNVFGSTANRALLRGGSTWTAVAGSAFMDAMISSTNTAVPIRQAGTWVGLNMADVLTYTFGPGPGGILVSNGSTWGVLPPP